MAGWCVGKNTIRNSFFYQKTNKMIPITNKNITQIVEKHTFAVVYYIKNRAKSKKTLYDDINKWLNDNFKLFFRKKITIEDILSLKFDKMKELVDYCEHKKIENFPKHINYIRDNLYKYVFPNKDEGFSYNKKPYHAYQMIIDLDISVCPYCNRNYIYNADDRRTSQLDHFFPESKYPFLAMSFYNLIPSCGICNFFKSAKPVNYSPYSSDINIADKRFNLKIKGVQFYNKRDDIEIELIEDNLKDNIKHFRLKSLYKEHSDIAVELIKKRHIYSDDYLETLYKQYEGTLFKNFEHLKGLIYGNYITDDEIGKRPLAKLTKDILEESGYEVVFAVDG